MVVDVERTTEGALYIIDKASPPGYESQHANTRFLEHLHVNCALSIEHVQADTCKDRRDIHTSLCQGSSEAGGMRSTQMGWDSAQQQISTSGTPAKPLSHR